MQTLTQRLIDRGLKNRVLSETQLARVSGGTAQRRYGLVNRALKAGELLRLKRGDYIVSDRFRDYPAHSFALAQAYVPGSYVSFETALAHHGWIPEAVFTTACVTPGKKSFAYDHAVFGRFTFHPLAVHTKNFLRLVQRLQITQQTMLVANPIRALIDLVCLRKVEWQGIGWLVQGLRIDEDYLHSIPSSDFNKLERVYKQKRVRTFLKLLAEELGHD